MADKPVVLNNFSLKQGQCVEVGGLILKDAKRFSINLGTAENNLVIHFDARFDYLGAKRNIIFNSLNNGVFGEELKESFFPLQDGTDTLVCFQFEKDKFLVQLPTGKPFSFPVRFPIEVISYLAIYNLQLKSITINEASGNRGAARPT